MSRRPTSKNNQTRNQKKGRDPRTAKVEGSNDHVDREGNDFRASSRRDNNSTSRFREEESKTDKAGKKSAAEDTQFEDRVSQVTRLPLQKATAEKNRRSNAGFKDASEASYAG